MHCIPVQRSMVGRNQVSIRCVGGPQVFALRRGCLGVSLLHTVQGETRRPPLTYGKAIYRQSLWSSPLCGCC